MDWHNLGYKIEKRVKKKKEGKDTAGQGITLKLI